jgi:hypothetical protein
MVSVTPRPRFSPRERTPDTHCTGGWVGPRACMDTEAWGKILSPLPAIEPRSPGRPVRSQTLYWLSYPGSHSKKYTWWNINLKTCFFSKRYVVMWKINPVNRVKEVFILSIVLFCSSFISDFINGENNFFQQGLGKIWDKFYSNNTHSMNLSKGFVKQ